MHRNDQIKSLVLALGRNMMKRHGFHNRHWQAPQTQQVGAHFSMSAAEQSLLRFPERGLLFRAQRQRRLILSRQAAGQHQFSHIMEQLGRKAWSAFAPEVFRFGNAPRQDSGGPAMGPEPETKTLRCSRGV